MKPLEVSELKAFIFALYQLDSPLPSHIQAQLQTINIPGDIEQLYAIAISHPPLKAAYDQIYDNIDAIAQLRSKGVESLPQYKPDSTNTEIDNASREIEEQLVKFDRKVDQNKLAVIAQQVFQALNPIKTAKEVINTIFSL
ncbi:hypothetical protein Ava_3506 [Trichormus variabilis ATCC 29413]|uniref:Uncharacterized protein n=2 Tax=Anabaena variabilis TaxID=264691 RepID=Q3M7C3_TRIV2|nr:MULTISPECIES: hypothetical protein [Nostocaceae]ABA23113.1 hypothetical protein Ava_3506 [Trichormus variabilis ATCC 29413]